MSKIIDFHTHAFADSLAERAMKHLTSECPDVEAYHDGRVSSLLASMDEAGISTSVVCPIATKPKQFEGIVDWCDEIRSERIVPFGSIHPDDERCLERIDIIKDRGLKGIKMHPYYQDFTLDEDRMMVIYEKIAEAGLLFVSHTGYDIAFEHDDRAAPERILNVWRGIKGLKFVSTHFGAWDMWDEVGEKLIGEPIYIEISFSLTMMDPEKAREMILGHPKEYLLFGTDSPWQGQKLTVELLKKLNLGDELEEYIFWKNGEKLLGLN